jgi:hypothetical protein
LQRHCPKKRLFFADGGGNERDAIAITIALSPERRMFATMIAKRAPQIAGDAKSICFSFIGLGSAVVRILRTV